jgi:hypothetical protein
MVKDVGAQGSSRDGTMKENRVITSQSKKHATILEEGILLLHRRRSDHHPDIIYSLSRDGCKMQLQQERRIDPEHGGQLSTTVVSPIVRYLYYTISPSVGL